MTLAYVFWHRPAPAADRTRYEHGLRAFHDALELPGSRTFRLDRSPYEDHPAYEDWYPVEGWAELGALNERAVSGARREPHDAAAAAAGSGSGGVYRQLQQGDEHDTVTWWSKPPGVTYADAIPELLRTGASVWQRQMVLGPAPEFLVTAPRGDGRQVRRGRL